MGVVVIVCILIVLYQILRNIIRVSYNFVIGPYLQRGPDLKKQGKWAVITGATDGLGKAYAEALAAKGIDIILISRTMEKLQTVATEIENKYKVETKVIEADFTNTKETYQHIEKNLHGCEIGILVNNVGLSYPYPEYFLEMDKNDSKINNDLINCNIFSVTNMCKLVLPSMIERRKGVIINMSSAASQIPSPLLAVYSATKAYIDKLSADLSTEYEKKGVIIQSIQPGFVATKMSKIKKATFMAPTPQHFVKHALTTIGIQEHATGYYAHSLMMTVIHTMQYFCEPWARSFTINVMENVRNRALKSKPKDK
ncbi:spidey [Carabus blaptoides fortunei]